MKNIENYLQKNFRHFNKNILFFDEFNICNSKGLFTEIMC